MTKGQAIHAFWSGFGLKAFDQTSVPDNEPYPYITYTVKTDSYDNIVYMDASIWYRSESWKEISEKTEEIAEYIVSMHPATIPIDNGRLYIVKGTPFAQRMADESDRLVKRMLLNINVEYLTAY